MRTGECGTMNAERGMKGHPMQNRTHRGQGVERRHLQRSGAAVRVSRWWAVHALFRTVITIITLLVYITTATAGLVILGGDDLTDHGSIAISGQLQKGWLYIRKAIEHLSTQVTRPGNDGSIAALGSASSIVPLANAGAAIGRAAAAVGLTVAYYDGATAINQFFADLATGVKNPAILWIAGTDSQNDLTVAEGQALTANAPRIADFVNAGGGLMAHYGGTVGYGWLTTVIPGLKEVGGCNS